MRSLIQELNDDEINIGLRRFSYIPLYLDRESLETNYFSYAYCSDLMELLREIPGREALKLRADVSS